MRIVRFALVILLSAILGCSTNIDIPLEYPTPPPPPQATPLPRLSLSTDQELQDRFAAISREIKGEIGIAAVHLESGRAAFLNGDERFPMQSVYKLPIAMAVMEKIKRGQLGLDEKIGVTADDMVRQGMRSPLRDDNPKGGEFTIRELIRLSMIESDGTASDVLLRVLDGAGEVQAFLTRIGIFDLKVANSEKEIGRDWNTQYQNYATPAASAELLRWLLASADPALPEDEREPFELLLKFMADSNPGAARIKGSLPKGTVVAHKTGTSGTRNGITGATNDIGIVHLPDGTHAAVCVYVSDSPADKRARERTIALAAKAVWDQWTK